MKVLGAWMIAWGIMALMFGMVGVQFIVLAVLDAFGPVMGYVLKVGLILAGIWVWRRDRVLTVEDEPAEGRPGAWVPVVTSAVVVVGIFAYVGLNLMRDSRLERQVRRPVPAAAWAATPTNQWPGLVLLQRAEFEHHTPLQAGCASLVRLPSGDIVALTAGHLLGRAGDVRPGFLRDGLGGLDQHKLATLTDEITSWDLFLPGSDEQGVEVVGLFGKADDFDTGCDQVLLRLSPHNTVYPVKPLGLRLDPVNLDESLYVVAYAANTNGTLQQVEYHARRVPGLIFTCVLDQPADLNGCSGAPVVDRNGLLVGIVTGALVDRNSRSDTASVVCGHLVSELMPVLKTAVSQRTAPIRQAGF